MTARAAKSDPSGARSPDKRDSYAHRTLGFGVPATSNPHHFVVRIPRGNAAAVLICEHLGMGSETAREQVIDRVLLERHRWTAIRAEVQRAFNARLKEHDLAPGAWKIGDTPVDRLLGKELCVLAWGVERLDPDKIGVAIRNWLALRPEERWWLFGMTAVATGGIQDADKGWRVALRYALGDVAQNAVQRFRTLSAKPDPQDPQTLPLFDD
ncbi:anti-phage-associated DUF3780 domain-containing protein [Thiocystis violacea]|uniref:anti-phage-associated DUF3780 domain-containing protein n=1 Tax=Thiocystis violacea TaxID=13725 RepID=UPI0019039847|nr:anti-phage-associated DUF3780 domain-containing protein [Thiocystis violacea]MBK1725037.1 hypothetical protein [Thiocystis violacea]